MAEKTDTPPVIDRRLGFMYKKIAMSYTPLHYWLTIPEFHDEMLNMFCEGLTIDNASVYNVAKRIYLKWECKRECSKVGDFWYRTARRGLNQLERILAENHEEVLH